MDNFRGIWIADTGNSTVQHNLLHATKSGHLQENFHRYHGNNSPTVILDWHVPMTYAYIEKEDASAFEERSERQGPDALSWD